MIGGSWCAAAWLCALGLWGLAPPAGAQPAQANLSGLGIGVQIREGETTRWSTLGEAGLTIKPDTLVIENDQSFEQALAARGLRLDPATLSALRHLNPQLEGQPFGVAGQRLNVIRIYGGGEPYVIAPDIDTRVKIDELAPQFERSAAEIGRTLPDDLGVQFERDVAVIQSYAGSARVDGTGAASIARLTAQYREYQANPTAGGASATASSTHTTAIQLRAGTAHERNGRLRLTGLPQENTDGQCLLFWAMEDYQYFSEAPSRTPFPLSGPLEVTYAPLVVWVQSTAGQNLGGPINVPEEDLAPNAGNSVAITLTNKCR